MSMAKTCVCGLRVEPGASCPCGAGTKMPRPPEAGRAGYRKLYASAEYRKARLERYLMVGGRCETPGCGIPLKGSLFPNGVPWEADHVGAEVASGGGASVHELRCRCVPHHREKTRFTRRTNGSNQRRSR